jgi:hypothetical protein
VAFFHKSGDDRSQISQLDEYKLAIISLFEKPHSDSAEARRSKRINELASIREALLL